MEFTLHNLPNHQAVEQVLGPHAAIQSSSIETYLLFLRVASDVFAAQQKQLACFGLSDGKISVLLQFLLAAPTPLSPSQLAERVGVTRATITDLVAGLVRDGWLTREACPQDGRVALLHLTETGHRRLEQALPLHFQRIQNLMQALDSQEKQDLVRLLTKISQNLSALQDL
ncbi:MarR family transcriptional regulator [Ktedonosporobacter rubrisoli]|uniref:MarR family transcriptional regulator n=1 Tax=Ktedonosporobacter rubrisoli TaxID=2509675 RepID=A0A4P6JLN9_KTERU|nr:MarR family transcriptional regulator [Ktedonosporobacter rubrisoli]QBD76124.1 MarR family transcriptional regulator [Ktedonosporobacter rubrisoli]